MTFQIWLSQSFHCLKFSVFFFLNHVFNNFEVCLVIILRFKLIFSSFEPMICIHSLRRGSQVKFREICFCALILSKSTRAIVERPLRFRRFYITSCSCETSVFNRKRHPIPSEFVKFIFHSSDRKAAAPFVANVNRTVLIFFFFENFGFLRTKQSRFSAHFLFSLLPSLFWPLLQQLKRDLFFCRLSIHAVGQFLAAIRAKSPFLFFSRPGTATVQLLGNLLADVRTCIKHFYSFPLNVWSC